MGRGRRPWAAVPAAVWALSAFAAVVAVALALSAFRHGSVNNDDAAYLLQARLLAGGRLLGELPADPEAQQPWFFAITADGYVPKYLPVTALVYAGGLVLFDSVVPVLAVLAFALPLAVWGLARTAGLAPRPALTATAVVALSPAVLVQGGLVLSYLPFLLVLVLAWTLLLVVWRSAGTGAALGFGVAAAVAATFRPFDPVVLLGPAALFVVGRLGRRAWRPALAAAAGAAPVVALTLAYNQRATGSALRLPFNLLTADDAFGYGVRRLIPEDAPVDFGPAQGLLGAWHHFLVEPAGWFLGFVAVAGLAAWHLRPGGAAGAPVRLLAASAGLFALSYLAFWGPWNASVLWGGTRWFGPAYALPTLVPLALAAASCWPASPWPARWPGRGLLAVAVVAALGRNVTTVARAVDLNREAARRTSAVLDAVRDAPGTVLVDVDPPYLAHPVGAVGNQPAGDGRTILLSSQLSPEQVGTVADPTLVQIVGGVYGGGGLDLRVVGQERTAGARLVLEVGAVPFRTGRTVLVVSRDGRQHACAFRGAVALSLTADAVDGCDGWPIVDELAELVDERPYRRCATATCLSFSLFRVGAGSGVSPGAWRSVPLAVDGTTVTALTDGGPSLLEEGRGWITVEARNGGA